MSEELPIKDLNAPSPVEKPPVEALPQPSPLLLELLKLGCMHDYSIDDNTFQKIQHASAALVKHLVSTPKDLIPSILVGIQNNASANEPMIVNAKGVLEKFWPTLDGAHKETPVNLLRLMLLNACIEAAEGNDKYAAIIWLTVVDFIPHVQIGIEQDAILEQLTKLSVRAEAIALQQDAHEKIKKVKSEQIKIGNHNPYRVNYDALLPKIAATAGPSTTVTDTPLQNPNPSWPNNAAGWSYEYSTRMAVLLKDELNSLADGVIKNLNELSTVIVQHTNKIEKNIALQMDSTISYIENMNSKGEAKIDTLWWYETLYSPSLMCSYREIHPEVRCVVMPLDLLDMVKLPLTPASVSYILAEALNRLPSSGFTDENTLSELLESLKSIRSNLPRQWIEKLRPVPSSGSLMLRDVVIDVISGNDNLSSLFERLSIDSQTKFNLPNIAKAIFRQEQALRLVG